MIFKRKIYSKLLDWKNTYSSNYALLIEGARRIGKSTIVEEFAKHEYKSYILINFQEASEEVISLWNDISDLDFIFLRIQSIYHVNLTEKESLIIFDEVQYCPKARQAIKALVKDGRYNYIETGSLISIKRNVSNILIPSEEMRINMYPMDFLEFLEAIDHSNTIQLLEYYISNNKSMTDNENRELMKLFRLYMLIGGMPQAVSAYIEKNNFAYVEKVKRTIIDLYDREFYKLDNSGKLSKLFNNIPSNLEHNKNRYNINRILEKQLSESSKQKLFSYLIDSKTVLPSFHVAKPGSGLTQTKELDKYKLFLVDSGLFCTLMFYDRNDNEEVYNDLYQKLFSDKLSANLGYLYENVVATQIASNGYNLYYHTFPNDTGHRNYEIDFLINMHSKTYPIEVKSSKWKTHPSLDAFSKKYSERIGKRIILHTKKLYKDEDIYCLPVYFAGMLDRLK